MTCYFCPAALLPEGWARNVSIRVDATGSIAAVETGAAPAPGAVRLPGPALPGMANLHSHAFQRAMAGLAERAGGGRDSFWTWRETMYAFLAKLAPEHAGAIAAQLYVEMLKAGYTTVGEFHYLHHRPDGGRYDDPGEMAHRAIDAARRAGIAITMLPVLYAQGGFGAVPPQPRQRRFVNDADRFLDLLAGLRKRHSGDPQIGFGVAPHSLRAVSPEALADALNGVEPSCPVHIHIAEQVREVEECVAWSGRRPVAWLFDRFEVDERWCLVHATHIDGAELGRIARSGAVVGLCPTTEANLGDGVFPLAAFLRRRGRFGIGSDSHVSVSPVEELRWLEYVQRLRRRARNIAACGEEPHTGARLWKAALAGGAQALARPIDGLKAGNRADFICLDADCPSLAGREGHSLIDSFVFSGNAAPVTDVVAGGRHVVRGGRHDEEEAIARAYRRAAAQLLD